MCKRKGKNPKVTSECKTVGLSSKEVSEEGVEAIGVVEGQENIVPKRRGNPFAKKNNYIKALAVYAKAMQVLTVLKWILLGFIVLLAIITLIGFIYMFLGIYGYTTPDPEAFFDSIGL